MSATTLGQPAKRPNYRRRRRFGQLGTLLLSAVLIVWSLGPVYNMVMIALDEHDDVLSSNVFPPSPSLGSFWVVITQGYWYLDHFWAQFGNSFYVGFGTAFLTLLIGSLTSFVIGRMHIKGAWVVSNLALITYVIPASFVAIPYYRIMQIYGWGNTLTGVISAYVAFAVPYAIFVFQQYSTSIPIALDESARIDGATPWQVYTRIYLPLMAPALVAVGTFALLLAWNDYLYQFLLLSSERNMTVAVVLAQFLNSDEAPWNYMMATAIIYAIPPIATYYAFRRYMTAGLTLGGVKG